MTNAGEKRIHSIDRTQERRLAAARRPDESGHGARRDHEIDVAQRLLLPVPKGEVLGRDASPLDRPRERRPDVHSRRHPNLPVTYLSLIHISEPTRLLSIS